LVSNKNPDMWFDHAQSAHFYRESQIFHLELGQRSNLIKSIAATDDENAVEITELGMHLTFAQQSLTE